MLYLLNVWILLISNSEKEGWDPQGLTLYVLVGYGLLSQHNVKDGDGCRLGVGA